MFCSVASCENESMDRLTAIMFAGMSLTIPMCEEHHQEMRIKQRQINDQIDKVLSLI